MKTHSGIIVCIVSALMLPVALHAAEPQTQAEPASESKPAAAKEKAGEVKAPKVKAASSPGKCEFIAGSRIRHDPPVDCDAGTPGLRSFSAEELQNTGETNLTEALRQLDTRLR